MITGTSPFPFLRMSPEEYSQYVLERSQDPENESYQQGVHTRTTSKTLRVVGYDDDARAAIRLSNDRNQDFLEVTWSDFDDIVRAQY